MVHRSDAPNYLLTVNLPQGIMVEQGTYSFNEILSISIGMLGV